MVVTPGVKHFDLVIVGGGITGIFCAYYMKQKAPGKRIAIIEKSMVGKGATSYSACLDLPYGHTDFKKSLSKRSRVLFSELKTNAVTLPIAETDFIGTCREKDIDKVLANITDDGVIRGKENTGVDGFPPGYNLPGGYAYFYNLKSYYAYDNIAYILACELARNGVTIYEGTTVSAIEKKQDGYELSTNYGFVFSTTAVIEATGPWMNKGFSSEAVTAMDLRVKKIVALHLDEIPFKNAPVIYFFDNDAFLLPQPHTARWLFSYRCDEWDLDIDGKDFVITSHDLSVALDVLSKYCLPLCDKVIGGRVYCDLYSPGGDPVIKMLDDNRVVVGAAGGSGFRLAPAMAEIAIGMLKIDA